MDMEKIRINKFIAEAGICSRREADRLLEAGKVQVNGIKATLGDRVSLEDEVTVNGQAISQNAEKLYIAFHNPYSVTTTTDKNSDNTVMDYIDIPSRIYPVGRLDVQSSGLLLLTNDGDIVNKILKSKHKLEKEYLVTLDKPIQQEDLQHLREGVRLEERKTLPATVKKITDCEIDMIIVQGMNRQIRRMCETLGYEVKKLERIRIGKIQLDAIPSGKWRYLTKQEVETLAS